MKKITGTLNRPRLSVARSNKRIYAQLINDQKHATIVSASGKLELAQDVGQQLAKKATVKNIKRVVFERGRYKYHGHVKALAEGAKKGGLIF